MMSVQNDFPDICKVFSIGKSFEGRDINVLQIDYNLPIASKEESLVYLDDYLDGDVPTEELSEQKKDEEKKKEKNNKAEEKAKEEPKKTNASGQKPAILITGATHARELISTSLAVYELLQLLQKGVVQKIDKWEKLIS